MTEIATPSPEITPKAAIKAILGSKIGMTQIFDAHGRIIPVTLVEAGPCHIVQVMTKEKHGYEGVQVTFGAIREKSVNKPDGGQFKKANVAAGRWVREFRLTKSGDYKVGQIISADAFMPGDYVDVSARSKGKGFAGAMKRHNFAGGPSTHGQSDRARAPGSSGSNTYPGRVFKGKKFPGHLGTEITTVQHLEIVKILADQNLIMIRGAIPGAPKSLVFVRETVKRVKHHVEHAAEHTKKEKAPKKDAGKAPTAAKPKGK